MKKNCLALLGASGLLAGFSAQAGGPQVAVEFSIEDLQTHVRTPASAARLDQYVCLRIRATLTQDGDHLFQLVIYDGMGREVHLSKATVTAIGQRWERNGCYGFNEGRDAPGTWWYVAELDGNPLFSESIEIRPAR